MHPSSRGRERERERERDGRFRSPKKLKPNAKERKWNIYR
jgi:hypothetical protein